MHNGSWEMELLGTCTLSLIVHISLLLNLILKNHSQGHPNLEKDCCRGRILCTISPTKITPMQILLFVHSWDKQELFMTKNGAV